MLTNAIYPFVAVVGQEQLKKALQIALVNQKAGGLLIGGEKGTAKSTLVRAAKEIIGTQKIVDLPLNATEDMLFGSIDIEYAVSKGERRFLPGILSRATGNILYIDEANLLRQELLTAVLDANASGINQVERDGISFTHSVSYTVIGTMNPEEGVLPGHILDRFGMYVDAQSEKDVVIRTEIIRRSLACGFDIQSFRNSYFNETEKLAAKIALATPQTVQPCEQKALPYGTDGKKTFLPSPALAELPFLPPPGPFGHSPYFFLVFVCRRHSFSGKQGIARTLFIMICI